MFDSRCAGISQSAGTLALRSSAGVIGGKVRLGLALGDALVEAPDGDPPVGLADDEPDGVWWDRGDPP